MMDTLLMLLGIYLIVINLMTFGVYGVDKWKAKHGRWRVTEATLLGLAFAGGFLGAMAGMKVWHHKTRKWKFKAGVPAALVLWAAAAVAAAYFCMK